MKIFLVFLITIALVKADDDEGPWVGGFRVKFGMGTDIGGTFMYDLPRNETQAIANGWTKMTPPERSEGPLSLLTMYCMPYYHFCIMYDNLGWHAGIQIAFAEEDISNTVFDFTEQGYVPWTVTLDGVETTYWAIHAYLCSEEYLALPDETRIAARNPKKTIQDKGVWVTGYNGKLVFISKNATELENNSTFTKQACFVWMGRHYYQNMTTTTPCTVEDLLSWFIIVESGEVIALGYSIIGNITPKTGATNVFENPTLDAVKWIVPNAPQCYYDYASDPGFTTSHIYFVDEPWYVSCIGQ